MNFKKVTIIGLGLIGGSLASALKLSNKIENIVGVDTNSDSIKYALNNNIIDQGFDNIDTSIGDSDVVVIATYVDTIPQIANEIKEIISSDTVVSDVGSVKGNIVNELEKIFGKNFVGAHPIAGTENSGVEFSDSTMFVEKNCILTPTENSKRDSIAKVKEIWEIAGSNIISISPVDHDHIFSNVSHLPHVVAYTLINTVSDIKSENNIFEFAGGGLKDYTRVASSSPQMWKSIFLQNKDEVLKSIKDYKRHIEEIEEAITDNDEGKLISVLEKAKKLKDKI